VQNVHTHERKLKVARCKDRAWKMCALQYEFRIFDLVIWADC